MAATVTTSSGQNAASVATVAPITPVVKRKQVEIKFNIKKF